MAMTNGVSAEAERLDRRLLGLDDPPGARLQDAQHDGPKARGCQEGPQDVEAGLGTGADRITDVPGHRQDGQHEDDLTYEDHPPRQHGRGPAADDGTDSDTGARHAADDGIGRLPLLALEVAGDERGHRGKHQRRADALEDRPPEGQLRDRLRHGGDARASRVDDEADHEGAPTADDVPDLAAGEHQHGHHQAVQGDDRLDGGHGRVEVRDQLTDRDIHDRLVQHHDELGARERDQRPPRIHRRDPLAVLLR